MSSVVVQPAALSGRIVHPGDPDYALAAAGWNELYSREPQTIVFARTTHDVVNALTWARENVVELRVRSGRHNLEGWSSVDNGIVIDVSELKSVKIDREAHTATVGAGLTQLEAVTALSAAGFAAPTGTEGSVGLVGATLGGGFGLLTRAFGMACDSLIGAEIVVAPAAGGAEPLVVDETHHAELLWALRGAGNGNFGIVTSMTFAVHPLAQTVYVTAAWAGLAELRPIIECWQATAPFVDSRFTSQLEIHRDEVLLFAVLAGGTEAEARELLRPMLSVGHPQVELTNASWGDTYAGFQIATPDEPAKWMFVSQFIVEPLPPAAITIITRFMATAPTPECNYFTNAFGGVVGTSEPAGGTAFAHRDALFYAEPGAGWGTRGGVSAADDTLTAACQTWVRDFGRALEPFVSGAYVNVPNAEQADWQRAYWRDGVDRLRAIKSQYDPENLFRFEQSIPLQGADV